MAIFNSCCFCITLRTGSLILGVISLIVSLLTTITSILALVQLSQEDSLLSRVLNVTINAAIQAEPEITTEDYLVFLWSHRLWIGLFFVISALSVICCTLLIYGTLNVSDWTYSYQECINQWFNFPYNSTADTSWFRTSSAKSSKQSTMACTLSIKSTQHFMFLQWCKSSS